MNLRQSNQSNNNIHRRVIMRCLCLHAMSVVYNRCHHEIGPVSDIPLLIYLLDNTKFPSERDCLLLLLDKLMLNKSYMEKAERGSQPMTWHRGMKDTCVTLRSVGTS
ncbi:unnamed protein product [Trichobilharzia regenti]|nr:unnamed protein product [Trichobilharzia regenti]